MYQMSNFKFRRSKFYNNGFNAMSLCHAMPCDELCILGTMGIMKLTIKLIHEYGRYRQDLGDEF